jgi:uncharacterized membrane protein
MPTISFFLSGVVLSLIFSFATIMVVRKSYREILEELCGTPQKAGYWIRVSALSLVVVTVLVAITFHGYRGLEQPNNLVLFWSLIGQITCILTPIFLSLILTSIILLRRLPHQAERTELSNRDLAQAQR